MEHSPVIAWVIVAVAAGITALAILGVALPGGSHGDRAPAAETAPGPPGVSDGIPLPPPVKGGSLSLEEAIAKRRSQRSFSARPLALSDVSQLLWAAQGITGERGFRSVPSAGALYPLEVLLVAGSVEGLRPGVYRYVPATHSLRVEREVDIRQDLQSAAVNQPAVGQAPATIAIAAVPSRTTAKYEERGTRYVHMEAGHAGQNVYLQAEALGLGTVAIGAFSDERVAALLDLGEGEVPLYLMPVGHPP
ncbi:MAG: SagB/ThcOx family dehydrogenase [Methanolinea sp.]